MLDVEGGAQQERFPAGTQQIAVRMAADLTVHLSTPVRRIAREGNGYRVDSDTGSWTAAAVIVAIPPAHRAAITFEPALSEDHRELIAHWPQGNLSKAYVAYDKPFWRAAGFSGEALSDEGPVFITFDVSPGDDGPGVLLGFTDARTFDPLPPQQRRERAVRNFTALFGAAAAEPIDYVDHCWGAEPFAPGGPTAAVPPGSWSSYGHALRAPVDGVFWAGTETADEWTGFLDGAVRSGQRAAAEVRGYLT